MDTKDYYNTCEKCGRPIQYATEPKCNYCDSCMSEYCGCKLGRIKEIEPTCDSTAVIPSITVESVEGITNLANCLVHVNDINTTFYVDDKHRVMITWAGPVDIPGYDMKNNPNGYRDQIVTDIEKGIAVIYDKHGKGYTFGIYDSLDSDGAVTQAINDKLAEMAADGTLADIISEYIGEPVYGFDTVADMKASTTLKAGDRARTLGFHSINDGGGALYKITDAGTANEMDIIAVGDLYAVLIAQDHITPEMLGAYGDGTHDDAPNIRGGLNFLASGGTIELQAGKTYLINSLDNPSETVTTFFNITSDVTICGKGTVKVADGFGDYDNIFMYKTALNNVMFKDFTINDNTSGNPVISNTGNSEGHHRTGFRLIGQPTKEIAIKNITFNDSVGVWQIIIERALKAEVSNIVINFNSTSTLSYDRTSIYFGALYGSVHGCKLLGGNNGLTAFELHGNNNILYDNYVEGYTTGVYITNQNITNDNIDKLEVCSNTFNVAMRGVSCWFTSSNIATKLVSIHNNLVNLTDTTSSGLMGIGNHNIVGNGSSIENYCIENNTIKTNNPNAFPFRFSYTQSVNTFTINNLRICGNNVSGIMSNAIRVESQADNTLKILSMFIDKNKFSISNATRFFHFIARQGFDYVYITNNVIESDSLTQFYRIFGTPNCETTIEGNSCNKPILANNIAGGDDVTGVTVIYENALLNEGTTFNALPANIKDNSVIKSGKYTCIKSDGKWVVNCVSGVMPTHQWFGKGSVINLNNDTDIMAIAKNNGYLGDHDTTTGDHKVGDWVVYTNSSAVWYCKADNSYTDNPSGHTDSFTYIGSLSSFYTVSAS